MKWETRRMTDVADFCLGKMLDEKKNKGDPLPYLANINVRWGEFELNNLRQMRFEPHEQEKYGLKFGDIVMCEGGEPGRCAIWKDAVPGMMIQKALHRIRPRDRIDHRFLYYTFLNVGRRGGFGGLLTGSTIKHLPREKLALLEIALPRLSIQQNIASQLAAYDDLIENNRRRIRLLEESARLLYREWFVHLRFPGHEHVKLVDGVPEGWKMLPLSALSESVSYGFTASASQDCTGPKFLRITDIVPPTIDWVAVPRCEISDTDKKKFLLRKGDIVVARTGATVGYAKRIDDLDEDCVFASYLIRVRLGPDLDDTIAGIFMESNEYKAFVKGNAGGAAQPNANARVLTCAELLVAPVRLQQEFRHVVAPILSMKTILSKQSKQLAQARDLLLPRLMNGEISV